MEVTSESAFQDIRKRIERENTPSSGRRVFSAATKSAIEDLLQEGHRPGFLSLKLGISESCLGKWKKRLSNNTSRPKQLQVVNHFPVQITSVAQLADADQIEVHLPNGIVLKFTRDEPKLAGQPATKPQTKTADRDRFRNGRAANRSPNTEAR